MKLRYLFSAVLASTLLFGCNDEELGTLDNITLQESYLSIPNAGGSTVLTVNSTDAWEFVTDDNWPDVIKRNSDKSIKSQTPSWLSADKMSGTTGETKVTFSAEAFEGGRELELKIKAGESYQFVRVRQGSMTAVTVTCAEANASPEGKNVRVKGVCTSIANTTYGNWYLEDATGSVYIYGTLDKDGKEKNFTSLGIELGDVIEVEGPVGSYKGSPQLVNVTVLSIKKSLVKVMESSTTISKKGGEFSVKVAYKGNGVFPTVPEDCDWVKFLVMDYSKGVPTKIEPSPADTAIVRFSVAPNSDDTRKCDIKFASYKGSDSSDGTFTVTQKSGKAYFEESFSKSQGAFTIENITLPEGSSFVWSYGGSNYGMKASSYVNKKNLASEALLVSPEIDLTDAEGAFLTFQHALNFLNGNNIDNHIALLVKKVGDADWTNVEIPNKPAGSNWTFVSSGDIDLSKYDGAKIQLAFKYVSTTSCAPTWEIKNVSIK